MAIIDIKDRSAVQAHINMLQVIINRMASNSANCKLFCITIFAASLALFFDGKTKLLEYGYIITLLFYFLDCFYLGLERQFVMAQNNFVKRINEGIDVATIEKQIFIPYPIKNNQDEECWLEKNAKRYGMQIWQIVKASISFSILPFYGTILFAIYYLLKNLSV